MVRLVLDQRWIYRILRHVLLFISMILLFTWVVHARSGRDTGLLRDLEVVLVHAIIFFGYAYLTVYLLIPKFLTEGRVVLFVVLVLLTGLALSSLKFLVSSNLFYQAISPENSAFSTPFSLPTVLVNLKDMTFIVAVFAIVKFARDQYVVESNIRELKQKGMEAEIKLLQHQMDPHVIFNNFNNLYSISINRPELLGCTVKSLKALLYYLFRESKHEKVLLSKEVSMIENYIGLERLRFGERLDVDFNVEGDLHGLEIAPLILYDFVENCFVHGAGEDPKKSWIRISISVNGTELRFYAANSSRNGTLKDFKKNRAGFNENSIRRLEILYPNCHRLAILDQPSRHSVELNVKLQP
jgi:sensor histidine kinase YesM